MGSFAKKSKVEKHPSMIGAGVFTKRHKANAAENKQLASGFWKKQLLTENDRSFYVAFALARKLARNKQGDRTDVEEKRTVVFNRFRSGWYTAEKGFDFLIGKRRENAAAQKDLSVHKAPPKERFSGKKVFSLKWRFTFLRQSGRRFQARVQEG